MKHYNKIVDLIKETLSFTNLKRLSTVKRIFAIILLSPFILVYTLMLLNLLLIGICLKTFEHPIKFLNDFLKNEGKDTKAAAEFIIYFIGFPIIFFGYLIYSLAIYYVELLYILAVLVGYIATLGGITFNIFISDENEKKEYSDEKFSKKKSKWFIIVGYILLALIVIFIVLLNALGYKYEQVPIYNREWGTYSYTSQIASTSDMYDFLLWSLVLSIVNYFLYIILFVSIGFKKEIKKPEVKEIELKNE